MKPQSESEDQTGHEQAEYAQDPHPLAGGVGAVSGGIAGAAIGSAIGPLGTATGAMLGAAIGTIAAKGIADGIDPDAETGYWERRYQEEPYHDSRYGFEDYGPAYQLGWRNYQSEMPFEAAEKQMSEEWERGKGSSQLGWGQARHAAKAGWDRVHRNQSMSRV